MGLLKHARDLMEFSYESAPAEDLPAAALIRLARQAGTFNQRGGVTGHLRLEYGRFLQTLEGPAETVFALAGRILADSRHQRIRVTSFAAIAERRFADWSTSGFEPELSGRALSDSLRFIPGLPARRTAVPASIVSFAARGS
jgi:hypothetical protein